MADCAALTLHRLANTWYTGANVPGKAQGVMPYTGGVGPYRSICDEVVSRGMLGFRLTGPNGAEQCNDGEIVRLQPDVRLVLGMLAEMKLPPIESLGAAGRARLRRPSSTRPVPPVGRSARSSTARCTVPTVRWPTVSIGLRRRGRIRSWSISTAAAGCWVTQQSDDPFCRDLCRRSGMIFVSVDYRHAPEHRFPAAAEDGYAATRWVAEHAAALGGRPGPVMVAGWSAGGNIAAVTCQLARDRGGPPIAGQLLVCPVTDCTFERPSYSENATGYFLTRSLMYWFWDLYCSPGRPHRSARLAAARQTRGLPPAFVVTCEFDPLRDEGIAYAEALAAAGVPVEQLQGAWPLPLVLHHGRRGDHRRQRARADGAGLAALRRSAGKQKAGRSVGPGARPRHAQIDAAGVG